MKIVYCRATVREDFSFCSQEPRSLRYDHKSLSHEKVRLHRKNRHRHKSVIVNHFIASDRMIDFYLLYPIVQAGHPLLPCDSGIIKQLMYFDLSQKRSILLSLILAFALNIWANDVDDMYLDSIFEVQEVIVVENRKKEIIPAQSLSGETLQNLNSQSVADALRYFSGVQIKDFGGIGGIKTVNIRSMGTHHIGVFYDGIQLGNAQNGQIDLGRYSLDNIEEIQLYNGQKSNIFQGAKDFGSSGTIYIRTRRPR